MHVDRVDDVFTQALTTGLSRRRLLAGGGGAGAALALGRLGLTAHLASASQAGGDVAGLVAIGGGRRLWRECRGRGTPTVVLEAGFGNDAAIWDTVALPPGTTQPAVLPAVATFTRVCAYDRPGTILHLADPAHRSRSDPVPMPRTAGDIVRDLHALLGAAQVPAPYVLVGHSLGGLFVRLYASTYPEEVVGLVLVDAIQEDYYPGVEALLTPAQWTAYTQPPADPRAPQERIDLSGSTAQLWAATTAHPLRPLPLVVLTHGRPFTWPAGFPVAALEALWARLQHQLAALVPNARLVVAAQSGHDIQLDQPDLVTAAIREVVDAVRDPRTWPGPVATPAAATPHL